MATQACKVVQDELMFLGDILSIGIVRKGLEKVGSTPDLATPVEMSRAMDMHVETALISFVGPVKARKLVLHIKDKLSKMEAS
ncbi:MAG: hypothetical protein R6W91_02830 [Thermoplasmata archaeon]